jgi:hypothetical protein
MGMEKKKENIEPTRENKVVQADVETRVLFQQLTAKWPPQRPESRNEPGAPSGRLSAK